MKGFLLAAGLIAMFPALSRGQTDTDRAAAVEWNQKGCDLFDKGETDSAIDAFHKALQLDSSAKIIRSNLALAYFRQGQERRKGRLFDAAVQSFRNAAEIDTAQGRYPYYAGLAFYEAGKTRDAADELRRTIRSFPEEIDAYRILGKILYDQGQCEDAIAMLQRGLAVLGSQPEPAEEDKKEREIREERQRDLSSLLTKSKRDLETGGCQSPYQSNHFDFHYDTNRLDLLKNDHQIAQFLEDAYVKVGGNFGVFPSQRFQVIFYDPKVFNETTRADEWVGGVFDGKIRIPVRDFTKERDRVRQVIFHEYTHALVFTITSRCPTWMNEGLAQIQEGGSTVAAENRLRAAAEKFLEATALKGSFLQLGKEQAIVAYDMSLSLTQALLNDFGYSGLMHYLRMLQNGQKKEEDCFQAAFGRTFESWVEGWRQRFS